MPWVSATRYLEESTPKPNTIYLAQQVVQNPMRLDYWLVSRDLSSLVIKSDIIHATISDHSAITFNLQSKEYAKRGQGFGNLTIPCLKMTLSLKNLAEKIPEFKDKHAY